MTQISLTITDSRPVHTRKTGLDEDLQDVATGRVTTYNPVDDMFEKSGIELNTQFKSLSLDNFNR